MPRIISKEKINPEILERMNTPVEQMGRYDIAGHICERLERECIPKKWMATALGVSQPNFTRQMGGHVPIPMAELERLLWILDGEE